MKIKSGARGILLIDDARIIFRNFAGEQTKFNSKGNRNFALVIDDEASANRLTDEGWNVKVKPPRDEDDTPLMFLPVKVNFNEKGPKVYLSTGEKMVELDEESVEMLDNIEIASVDLDIRPYDWEVNGRTGRTAYLEKIHVIQVVDRFAARYEN
jgi:hypothetical protein